MNIEKELGEFYSSEKEEIQAIILKLESLVTKTGISEDVIRDIISCEDTLSMLRKKYTDRLFRLYKLGFKPL